MNSNVNYNYDEKKKNLFNVINFSYEEKGMEKYYYNLLNTL